MSRASRLELAALTVPRGAAGAVCLIAYACLCNVMLVAVRLGAQSDVELLLPLDDCCVVTNQPFQADFYIKPACWLPHRVVVLAIMLRGEGWYCIFSAIRGLLWLKTWTRVCLDLTCNMETVCCV
jgi:hypothetical protein